MEWTTDEEMERLEFIRKSYRKNIKLGAVAKDDPMSKILAQINLFNDTFNDYVDRMTGR